MKKKSTLFIITRSSLQWKGAEGIWIMMAGWAHAAQDLWGTSYVCTTDDIFSPEATLDLANSNAVMGRNKKVSFFRRFIPELAITIFKDVTLFYSKPKIWPIENELIDSSIAIKFICERHDLFSGVGYKLAKKNKVPFLLLVDAPVVWEAKKWGVRRGLWGIFLEKYFESKSLRRADLVVCISEKVKDKVIELGVKGDRTIVIHNKVNNLLFKPNISADRIIREYDLDKKIVIGWTGSFRSFHGLDSLIEAFKLVCEQRTDVRLMLVGDGQDYQHIYNLIQQYSLNDYVILTGKQPYKRIPEFVSSFDIAIVSARNSNDFHYSPLKLQEYFACGIPTIIPEAGDLSSLYKNAEDVLFYQTGDSTDLSIKINDLISDAKLREKLINAGLNMNDKNGTWKSELNRIEERIALF
jgi:glycosyltransferase involved in cell wall biosynthesis